MKHSIYFSPGVRSQEYIPSLLHVTNDYKNSRRMMGLMSSMFHYFKVSEDAGGGGGASGQRSSRILTLLWLKCRMNFFCHLSRVHAQNTRTDFEWLQWELTDTWTCHTPTYVVIAVYRYYYIWNCNDFWNSSWTSVTRQINTRQDDKSTHVAAYNVWLAVRSRRFDASTGSDLYTSTLRESPRVIATFTFFCSYFRVPRYLPTKSVRNYGVNVISGVKYRRGITFSQVEIESCFFFFFIEERDLFSKRLRY